MPMLYCDAFLSPALSGRASHVLHVLVALAYCGGVNIRVVLSTVFFLSKQELYFVKENANLSPITVP